MIGFAGFPLFEDSLREKVQRFYALAPVTKVGWIKSPIRVLAKHIDDIAPLFGEKDFLEDPHHILKILGETICVFEKSIFIIIF